MNAELASQREPLMVVGSNKGRCQLIAQWLSDIGGLDSVIGDLKPPHPYIGQSSTLMVVVEDERDVALVRRWTADLEAPPPMVGLLAEPSWPLLLDLVALPIGAAVVLPVSGDLLLHVLLEVERPRPEHDPIVLLSSDMLRRLPQDDESVLARQGPPLLVHLTPRELQILTLLDREFSNERIANALVISPHTVKRHLENLFAKLGVRSRHEAVRLAHSCGIIRTRRGDRKGPNTSPHPTLARDLATS